MEDDIAAPRYPYLGIRNEPKISLLIADIAGAIIVNMGKPFAQRKVLNRDPKVSPNIAGPRYKKAFQDPM
jgi:hypothetical protein